MTVTLTSPVLGQAVGYAYTGVLESWLLNEGYARNDADSLTDAITVTPTVAKLTGGTNAVNIVTGGNLVVGVNSVLYTIALLAADTPAAAATKIDTALTGVANSAIVSSKLEISTVATGPSATVAVVSGTGTVLANLGVTAGSWAQGGDGRPVGASNLGAQADTVANDPTRAANREAPYFPRTPDRHTTIANDATHLTQASLAAPNFDVDIAGTDTEAPSQVAIVEGADLPLGGGRVVISGNNLEGVTGVTFGGTAGTALDVTDAGDGVITVTAPAKTAGSYNVVVTDAVGSATITSGVTYA